jgi:2-polyprenyl-6-methoxyphenol hydroxylase-like FAD-dependent oxidoreductase
MSDIGIVGGGTAGLHLALLLQQGGLAPTLYAERTADEVRRGRLPNTVVHNHRTRSREREIGVNHWDKTAPAIEGHWHCIGELPPFPGFFTSPSLAVDYRVYQAKLLEDFEERGGTVVVGAVGAEELPGLGERHDLIAVSTGRGGFSDFFPAIPDRSPFDQPQRLLMAGLYTGVADTPDSAYVALAIAPPNGEVISIPMESLHGVVTVILVEAVPGGDLEVLARTPYADDPKAYERLLLEKLRAHASDLFARIDQGAFALTRPDDILQGAVTPTVRQSYAQLDDGTYAIAVGDAHVAIDPVVGLGANAASLSAFALGETIFEGGPFDEEFCKRADDRRLPGVLAHFDFTNLMLAPPPPQVLALFGAMSQNLALANDVTDNFTDPGMQLENLAGPEATEGYIASFSS